MINKKRTVLSMVLMAVLIFADRLSKVLAVNFLKPVEEIPIIGKFLVLSYCENDGAAFSILRNNKIILIGLTGICIVLGLFYLYSGKVKSAFLFYFGISVISGGIGNLYDRIAYGYVVDFIYFKSINFAIFNFADICITVGGIAILVYVLFSDKAGKDAKD